MTIIQIIGGLGNQMFQYALFRSLHDKDSEVYYETFDAQPHHNGFELDKIFNIIQSPASDRSILFKLSRFQEESWSKFNPEVLNKKNTYICGNWQNRNYFPADEILNKDFTFKQELDPKNQEILKEIQESNSVSLHVRRTDYISLAGFYFQATWINYYGIAVNHISKNAKEKPLKFFVFSDDIEWCKKNFMIPAVYVENKGANSWKDMLLMSNCKHNIIANSTFSWWGAWLNKNPEKMVITPKQWISQPPAEWKLNPSEALIDYNKWIKI